MSERITLSFPETTGEGERRVYATPETFYNIFRLGIDKVATLPDLAYLQQQIEITAKAGLLNPVLKEILEVLISFKRRELLFPLRSSFFENFVINLGSVTSLDQLFELETQAQDTLESGLLTQENLKLIKEKIEEKRQQLQEFNFEDLQKKIKSINDEAILETWKSLIDAYLKVAMITRIQYLQLLEDYNTRKASLTQYI